VKSLDAVMAQIEKTHGKGAVMRLGDEVRVPIDVIPTGSIALDVALGIGGLPRGRVIETLRPGELGQDDGRPARGGQRPEGRRYRGVHRRRARP